MNPQPDEDLEHRFQKLEAINQSPPPHFSQTKQSLKQTHASQPVQRSIGRSLNWFNGLSGLGKLLVVGIAALVGFTILQAVLKLVTAVVSLAILGVILYLIYQFFLSRSSETKD